MLGVSRWTVFALILAAGLLSQHCRADLESDTKTGGGFTSYVSADITSPAKNAVFHTGGPIDRVGIVYASENVAKVTSDGSNNQNTSFAFEVILFLDPTGNTLASGVGGEIILAGVAATFGIISPHTLQDTEVTVVGGHTANSRSTTDGGTVTVRKTDQHSLTVVAP